MKTDKEKKYEPHRQEGDPQVIPPQHHIQYAGHHWLQRFDFDGHPGGHVVLQWQPISRRWCLPNDYARGNDFDVEHYRYVAPCPMPSFPDDLERLRKIMRECDGMAKGKAKTITMNAETWEFVRDMIYPTLPLRTSCTAPSKPQKEAWTFTRQAALW